MSWDEDLRPASWRGLPFGVWSLESRFGRALAVHEYPFRDSVSIEDLGRAGRRYRIIGFLIGDDVIEQEAAMIEAAEEEGPGELMHPTLGSLMVSCQEFSPLWRHDLGRVVEVTFYFLEEGQGATFGAAENLASTVGKWADELDVGAAADFAKQAGDALKTGIDVARQARATLRGWTSMATRLVGDARSALGVVGAVVPGLDRRLSRFASGLRSRIGQVDRAFTTVGGALSRLSRARHTVTQGTDRVGSLLDKL
ncbi:DNA circularization N-terminal domain-containing protein [Roseomonas xinghualingensis]|uniref:DNA circularization N-terminal domain-containing protein n=1 Tax=Roseomonas xinghualingensis TaxID=2986475 RepID=UPI0021F22EBA|nr:DNA circularization N-terminal domain-containing protein [Roseomonas sp. SXEYE001]MCV4206923.1 DNA circularization N-terminal domain-containing protein [Roseomonas sp. SXEYE001]